MPSAGVACLAESLSFRPRQVTRALRTLDASAQRLATTWTDDEGHSMLYRSLIGVAAVGAAMMMTSTAQAFDDAKYPDLSGQWVAVRLGVGGLPAFDPTKPWGRGQQAPLT